MLSLKCLLAYWILLFFVFRCIVPSLGVSCKGFGHHNPPDDWFVLYKLPRKINDENRLVQKGNAFIYMTSNQQKWAFSEIGIDEKYTPIYNTLQQIYDRPNNSGLDFGMYNDQPPNTERVATIAGQTKGAFAFDELGGFWMITSTPRFPMPHNSKNTYVFPERFLESSQIIICISLDKDQKQKLKNSIFRVTIPYNYSGVWDIPERTPPSSDIMIENVGTGYIYFTKHRRTEKGCPADGRHENVNVTVRSRV
ncbi:plancitoxin-1-like [Saccostrea cucullata]|uniref:plancitoxin-1-like n=1 Tax=Saccostrea cuccullata TaxID=36930 RepID=UPI002ED4F428